MKISIRFIVTLLLLVLTALIVPVEHHEIMTWQGNRSGALSLTFDDGFDTQYSFAVPALNQRGLKGTFFLLVDNVTSTWDWWRKAANAGHEIGSHTLTHPNLALLPPSQAENEIATSQAVINANIPNQECITFAYPYGILSPTVEALVRENDIYIGARGTKEALSDSSTNPYNVGAYDVSRYTVSQMEALTDQAASQGKWLIPCFHSFKPTRYGKWTTEMFLVYIDYLKNRKDLWIAPFGTVARYMRERGAATLSVSSQTSDRITLNLTDTLEDATYNCPLTLRSEVPVNWSVVNVQQGNTVIIVSPVVVDGKWVVYYDAVPDKGAINLTSGV